MKMGFSLMTMLAMFFCFGFTVLSQSSQQTLKPVEFITKGTHVFLKAEMSLASPDDLKRPYMQWCSADEEYKDRQFIAKGMPGWELVMAAFRTTGNRVIDKANLPKTPYSVEIIVPIGCEHMLDALFKQTVQSGLGVTAAWETAETKVGILKRNPIFKPNPVSQLALKPSKEAKGGVVSWGESSIKGVCEPITVLAGTLGGVLNIPVLDETGLKGNYDFNIKWKENSPGSLEMALEGMGLSLVTENRPMEMVVIRTAVKSGSK